MSLPCLLFEDAACKCSCISRELFPSCIFFVLGSPLSVVDEKVVALNVCIKVSLNIKTLEEKRELPGVLGALFVR